MPSPRERTEEIERQVLSPYATLAVASKGRERQEEPDALRTCFQRDRDRIVHSKAFRRLKHKTQVFLAPEGQQSVSDIAIFKQRIVIVGQYLGQAGVWSAALPGGS